MGVICRSGVGGPCRRDVRLADIAGLDQEADGGTRVASTLQVGRIQVVKVENKDEGFRRLRIRSPIEAPV